MHDQRERFLIRYAGGFAPLVVARASGAWVETTDGRRILDFTSGQICSTVGHNHPRIVGGDPASLDDVVHLNSWMLSEPVLALGERLAGLAPDPLDRVMLLNTGSEANEVAVKLAKLATGRFEVVGLTRSFHGLLAGSGSVTYSMGALGLRAARAGLARAARAVRLPLPDPPLRRRLRLHVPGGGLRPRRPAVGRLAGALVVEPVLSAGGIIVPPPGLLPARAELCARARDAARDRRGADRPRAPRRDVRLRARRRRARPPGAVQDARRRRAARRHRRPEPRSRRRRVAKGFLHVTSHVSDPLPAAAGLAVLDVIEEEGLVARAAERGEYLLRRLRELQDEHEQIGDVRGRGLLVGLELVGDRDTREPADALGARRHRRVPALRAVDEHRPLRAERELPAHGAAADGHRGRDRHRRRDPRRGAADERRPHRRASPERPLTAAGSGSAPGRTTRLRAPRRRHRGRAGHSPAGGRVARRDRAGRGSLQAAVGAARSPNGSARHHAVMGERAVVEASDTPRTRASIAADLRASGRAAVLGVARAQFAVEPRLGVRRRGRRCGALLDVLGPNGMLVVPTHTAGNSDPAGWENPPIPQSWWRRFVSRCRPSIRGCTPSTGMGAVAELVRTWPGARRSEHPQMSFAALGPRAEQITAGHALGERHGRGLPARATL